MFLPIKLILICVPIAAPYFLPTPDSWDKFLTSYLQKESLVWVVKSLSFFLLLAIPYAVLTYNRRPSIKDQQKAISKIKDSALAKHELRLNDLSDEVQTVASKYASRGFSIPSGMMAKDIFDLCKKELTLFWSIIEETIDSYKSNNTKTPDAEKLCSMRSELLQEKAEYLKSIHSGFINSYFSSYNSDMAEQNISIFNQAIDQNRALLTRSIAEKAQQKHALDREPPPVVSLIVSGPASDGGRSAVKLEKCKSAHK